MNKGDKFTFPCGATVEITYLERPQEHSSGGLVGVLVKSNSENLTISNGADMPLRKVELRFRPANIDQLMSILSGLQAALRI